MVLLFLTIVTLATQVTSQPIPDTVQNASVPCNGPLALAARFRFAGGTAEAFFHVQSGWAFFEYIAPRAFFHGIGATMQTGNTCFNCIEANAKIGPLQYDDTLVFTKCLKHCFDGNQFVLAGRGDPTNSEIDSWIIENTNFSVNASIPSNVSPTALLGPLDDARLGGTFRTPNKRIFDFNGISYIHIWWYREFRSSSGDEWMVPLSGGEPICWTWARGAQAVPSDPNRASITSFNISAVAGGVVCENATMVCTPAPTGQPTLAPVAKPTTSPTPSPTLQPIPSLEFKLPDDLCLFPRNFSLNIVLDGSKSISDSSYVQSKQWAFDVVNASVSLAARVSERVTQVTGIPVTVCVRTSVMTFAVASQIVWDLNQFGECLTSAELPQAQALLLGAPRPDPPTFRFRGTHTRDVLLRWRKDIFPQRKGNETTILLMATDGLPKSVFGPTENQRPCGPTTAQRELERTFESTDTRFFLVGIGFVVGNVAPFQCLEKNRPRSEWLLQINSFIDLQETNIGISNSILGELCGVRDIKCDYPLFVANNTVNSTNPVPVTGFNQSLPNIDFGIRFVPINKDIWIDNFTLTLYNNCTSSALVMEADIFEFDPVANTETKLATSYNVTVPFLNLSQPLGFFRPSVFFKFMQTDAGGNELRMFHDKGFIYTFVFRIVQGSQCASDVIISCVNLTEPTNFTDPNPTFGVEPVIIRVDEGIIGSPPVFDPVVKSPAVTVCLLDLIPIQTTSPTMSPTPAPTDDPTGSPSRAPSRTPTRRPTDHPTSSPTRSPSRSPTRSPTDLPTSSPTKSPTTSPSLSPSQTPTKSPTNSPTKSPTNSPSSSPTRSPTSSPSASPSSSPSKSPSQDPTRSPSASPTSSPSGSPTKSPSTSPSRSPTQSPTGSPSSSPTQSPSGSPTKSPTSSPTRSPSASPSKSPTGHPTTSPTKSPSSSPTRSPSTSPTRSPSVSPTFSPTQSPSSSPTQSPSKSPSNSPSSSPTKSPTGSPTKSPSGSPTKSPTRSPSLSPSGSPTRSPSQSPTKSPSSSPTTSPSKSPTRSPSSLPTKTPSASPTGSPSNVPTNSPTRSPSTSPTPSPSTSPSKSPSSSPTGSPSTSPTRSPSGSPTSSPSRSPSDSPTKSPSMSPSSLPTKSPTGSPTRSPSASPARSPTTSPSKSPSSSPTKSPTMSPSSSPTQSPSGSPTRSPSSSPTLSPSNDPSRSPSQSPTTSPTRSPSDNPSGIPTRDPSQSPTGSPTRSPTTSPSKSPTFSPTASPSKSPTRSPSSSPSGSPTSQPSSSPSRSPTTSPSRSPTQSPSVIPTDSPSKSPTNSPTKTPTKSPSSSPTQSPSKAPSQSPSDSPSMSPTKSPTNSPTSSPSRSPSDSPTRSPSPAPTDDPTKSPSGSPTRTPTRSPSRSPTKSPTNDPSKSPTTSPTKNPTESPTPSPTGSPSNSPTRSPTETPTKSPSSSPSDSPTGSPTRAPTKSPTNVPTPSPTGTPSKAPSRSPSLSPTPLPTLPPSSCPTPPMFKPKMCTNMVDPMTVEWQIDGEPFYEYDARRDITKYVYRVCTLKNRPNAGSMHMTRPLDSFWLQVGCKCEICLDDVTKGMKPSGRVNNYLQTWRWDVQVVPGECVPFKIKMFGYVPPIQGTYMVSSFHECAMGHIKVPDPCDTQSQRTPLPTPAPTQCMPRYPAFPKKCMSVCNSWDAEWKVEFIDRVVAIDAATNLTSTTFSYKASVRRPTNPDNATCYHPTKGPQALEELHIRLPCDCDPDRTFIQRQVVDIEPVGFVDELSFSWYPRDLTVSEMMTFTIILAGDIPKGVGDFSVGGDYRCMVQPIDAPNLCSLYTAPPPQPNHQSWNNDGYHSYSSSSSSSSSSSYGRWKGSRRSNNKKRSRSQWP